MSTTTKVIPYSPKGFKSSFKRVIVKPIPKEEQITEAGLLIPTDIGRICEHGIVYASDENSTVKPGDRLLYQKLDRTSEDHVDTVVLEGDIYDAIYEQEIWAVNEQPFNKLFVRPTSDLQVSESGLIMPDSAKGITQKAIIFRSGIELFPEGASVEYRKQEQSIHPTIEIEGSVYDVLNETDIFMLDGFVAPYRILVKIDMVAQRSKRQNVGDSGLIRSQLFLFMKYNLQYAEVVEIGCEASRLYPGMKVGDTAILHHTVEDRTQNYRIIKWDIGPIGLPIYEYRIINSFDTSNREILGRIANRKDMIVSPYGKSVFLDWEFDVMQKTEISSILGNDFDTNLDKSHNLEDLIDTIKLKKSIYTEKSAAKVRGYLKLLPGIDPVLDKDTFHRYQTKLAEAKDDAIKLAAYLNGNHLVICRRTDNGVRVVVPYRELYPIEIMGKKFLVGWSDYILGEIHGSES